MQKKPSYRSFLVFVVLAVMAFLSGGILCAQEAPEQTVSTSTEKLFYSVTLNESFFIGEHDATMNARVVVNVLQGSFDTVVFEMLGQGDVENVNGEQVKDWSIRKNGAKQFLEIRSKENLHAGGVFNATVVGRQSLELPTTIQPLILSSTTSTAFTGLLRVVSPSGLRLYAKQARGLISIGTPESNELSYGIIGTPLLRLDVARGNELLAPVSLEGFTLHGNVDGDTAHFRIRATAAVREINAEIPVLSGDAALKNFSGDQAFSIRVEVNEKTQLPTYFLRFQQRGEFSVDLEFDARITEGDGWRRMNFAVPAVQVAPFAIYGLGDNILFAPSSVSVPQLRGDAYEGFLPANGEFNMRWQEESGMPPEFSSCIFSADMCSELRVSTGMLKQREEVNLSISQGAVSYLVFDLVGTGDILNVTGADVLSWSIEKINADNSRVLHVSLSQKKRGAYTLWIESQTAFQTLPTMLSPLRIVPLAEQPESAVCVRFNEFLRLRNDGFVRVDVMPRVGVTQIAPSAFPQKSDYFKKDIPAGGALVYRVSGAGSVQVKIDSVRPDVSVIQTSRCYFDEKRIISLNRVQMNIRSAPLYEWLIELPADAHILSMDADKLAGYENVSEANGVKTVKAVFTEPLIGEHELRFGLNHGDAAPGKDFELRGGKYPQARFVRGFVGLAGAHNVRLIPSKLDGLSEVPAEFYPVKNNVSLPQQVFRMRDANWMAVVRAEKMLSSFHGSVSTVYKISGDKIYGDVSASVESGTEPLKEVQFSLPRGAELKSAIGEGLGAAVSDGDVITIPLQNAKKGEVTFLLKFEIKPEKSDSAYCADFSGVRLQNVSGERGEIFVTSDKPAAISSVSEEGNSSPLMKLSGAKVKDADFSERGGAILLGAYQYVSRPFSLELNFMPLQGKDFPQTVVTDADVSVSPPYTDGAWNDLSLKCNYKYVNSGAGTLKFRLPAGKINNSVPNVTDNGDGTYSVKLMNGSGSFEFSVCDFPLSRAVELKLPQIDAPVLQTRVSGLGQFAGTVFKSGRTLNENFAHISSELRKNMSDRMGIVCLTALCIFAGILIVFLTTPMWNILKFACAAVGTVAGTIALGIANFYLFNAAAPTYLESVAEFSFGESAEFVFHPMIPFVRVDFLDLPILAVGLFILAAGSILFRSIIMRIVGRVVFYGSLVAFVPDVENCIPSIVLVILLTETFLLVIDFCFALKKKFSNGEKPRPPKPTVVNAAALVAIVGISLFGAHDLRAEENQDTMEDPDNGFSILAVQSETIDGDGEFSRPQNMAERISQAMKILSDRVESAGEIRIKGRAGERFDLLEAPAVLTHFEKKQDSDPIRLERRRGKNGIVYQVVLERSGTFSAEFGYELALAPEARGLTLLTGNAAADAVMLLIARPDIRLGADGAVTLSVDSDSGSAQIAHIVFKPLSERKIFWNPRERDRRGEELSLYADGTDLYVPAAGVVEGYHTFTLTPARGEFDSIEISIPEPFSVSRVEGNSIRRWNFGADRILTILLDTQKTDPVDISVYTQAALNMSVSQSFSPLQVLNCKYSARTLGIATGDDLQIDSVDAGGLIQVDEKEFSEKLLDRATASGAPVMLRRAYRVSGEKNTPCKIQLSEVKPNLKIYSSDLISLDRDKVTMNSTVTAEVSKAAIFNLAFKLPDGMEIESISGEEVAYWSEFVNDGIRSVMISLKKQFSGEEKFNIALVGEFPIGSQQWSVPRIIFEGAKVQLGEVVISAEDGLKLSPKIRENVVESSAETSKETDAKDADFVFRYFGGKWNLVFSIGASQVKTAALWTEKVSPLGRYCVVNAKIRYSVENAMRQVIRVKLPANALAPRFSGTQVINSEPARERGDTNLWEVRLAKPMRGDVDFGVEYFVPLSAQTHIEAIGVVDVDEEIGRLQVDGGDVFSVSDQSYRDGNFSGKSFVLTVNAKSLSDWETIKTDAREGSFLDPVSRRFSVVSDVGAVTEDVISLTVNRTDLLRIVQGDAELMQVYVDGIAANLFSDADGILYLPLYRKSTEGSTTATQIRILYRSEFVPGNSPMLVPVRTSAHPRDVTWNFAGTDPAVSLRVVSLFGLDMKYVEHSNTQLGWKFLGKTPELAYFTSRYPHIDAGAMFAFDAASSIEQSSHRVFFAGILFLVLLLRGFVCLRSRRKNPIL